MQLYLSKNPELYLKRNPLFGKKIIDIAGKRISLDEIEHGLLRHSKVKWGLGYINNIFPSHFEKMHRVSKVDYRLHFALNCGAGSCSAIAFYTSDRLDEQL